MTMLESEPRGQGFAEAPKASPGEIVSSRVIEQINDNSPEVSSVETQRQQEYQKDVEAIRTAYEQDPGFKQIIDEVTELAKDVPGTISTALIHQTFRGILESRQMVIDKFEKSANTQERLAFHNWEHSAGVIRRTLKLLRGLALASADLSTPLVTKEQMYKAALFASYHDTVQEWKINEIANPDGSVKQMRQRFAGLNEKASANLALAHMLRANALSPDGPVYNDDDFLTGNQAISGTIPGFSPSLGTVTQPQRQQQWDKISLVAESVALADLGTAGMDGPASYLGEGDALFREENLDILGIMENGIDALADSPTDSEAAKQRKADLKQSVMNRMLGWSKFQPIFADGRRKLLEGGLIQNQDGSSDYVDSELFKLRFRATTLGIKNENFDQQVTGLFDKFQSTVEASAAVAKKRQQLVDLKAFWTLAKDMGYTNERIETLAAQEQAANSAITAALETGNQAVQAVTKPN